MKTNFNPYLAMLGLLVLVSCQKNTEVVGTGCISRVTKTYMITAAQRAQATTLLQSANIDYSGLTISGIERDTFMSNTGQVNDQQSVFADQYVNGLRIFFADVAYTFVNGTITAIRPTRYTTINQGTTPVSTLAQIRQLYINASAKDSYESTKNFKDSCLSAELGYYISTYGPNNTPVFVKAWYVTPKNSAYPFAYFMDGSGTTISYFNGFFTGVIN